MLHVASVCTPCCMLLDVVAQRLKPVKLLATHKRTQQLPTVLHPFAHGLKLTELWNTGLLFDLNYKFINGSLAFSHG